LTLQSKELTFKAKDSTLSAKAKDLTFKAKDLTYKAKAKDLTFKDKANGNCLQNVFHRSQISPLEFEIKLQVRN